MLKISKIKEKNSLPSKSFQRWSEFSNQKTDIEMHSEWIITQTNGPKSKTYLPFCKFVNSLRIIVQLIMLFLYVFESSVEKEKKTKFAIYFKLSNWVLEQYSCISDKISYPPPPPQWTTILPSCLILYPRKKYSGCRANFCYRLLYSGSFSQWKLEKKIFWIKILRVRELKVTLHKCTLDFAFDLRTILHMNHFLDYRDSDSPVDLSK